MAWKLVVIPRIIETMGDKEVQGNLSIQCCFDVLCKSDEQRVLSAQTLVDCKYHFL